MHDKIENRAPANCSEFHEQLPLLMETGAPIEEHPHLRSCENCSALVRDLKYIAEQAKLLLPLHDPSPRVWNNIQQTLEQEGYSKEGRLPGHGPLNLPPQKSSWMYFGWAAAFAAAILVTIGLYQIERPQPTHPQTAKSTHHAADDRSRQEAADDQQLLEEISQRSPGARTMYEQNLNSVNQYIRDARTLVQEQPDSEEAGQYLREAYAQKAVLYQMATARSLE